jgi:hypothetical protein
VIYPFSLNHNQEKSPASGRRAEQGVDLRIEPEKIASKGIGILVVEISIEPLHLTKNSVRGSVS